MSVSQIKEDAAHIETCWLVAAASYGGFLNESVFAGPKVAEGSGESLEREQKIAAFYVDNPGPSALQQTLDIAYQQLDPGDIIVINLPGRTSETRAGTDRDTLGRDLHRAGFECPMIWAGRLVLNDEPLRRHLLHEFLSQAALGAGPLVLPNVTLNLEPDRLVALARRSALVPAFSRPWLLSVVMPVYNERSTFREVMERLLAKRIAGVGIEICLVESNSTDGTREQVLQYANHPRVRLTLEDKPCGKGHAVRNGLALATGDIVLIQDADLEYDLDDYERLIEPIRNGEASFVLGSRHPGGEKSWRIRHFAGQRRVSDLLNVGHLFFTYLFNFVFEQKLRDPFTMFKVFRRACIHNVRFECNRFDFDIELVGKLIRNGYRPVEIDIHYQSRSFEEGKKVSIFRDPPTWIRACLKHRFSNLRVWPKAV